MTISITSRASEVLSEPSEHFRGSDIVKQLAQGVCLVDIAQKMGRHVSTTKRFVSNPVKTYACPKGLYIVRIK